MVWETFDETEGRAAPELFFLPMKIADRVGTDLQREASWEWQITAISFLPDILIIHPPMKLNAVS